MSAGLSRRFFPLNLPLVNLPPGLGPSTARRWPWSSGPGRLPLARVARAVMRGAGVALRGPVAAAGGK